MDERRAFLKSLAQRSADAWGAAAPEGALRGETRIETRNTIYQLRDGVCIGITRRESHGWRADPTVFIGMRVVGWLAYENPRAGITAAWRPGSYAVLWRQRRAKDVHSSVALTSASLSFEKADGAPKKAAPPPVPPRKTSGPAPLAPVRALPRPVTPAAFAPRAPLPSRARASA
jgi:hypothetical protein